MLKLRMRYSDKSGFASGLELALHFAAWAHSCRHADPSVAAIRDHWHVSRATAYRWQAAWRAVRGARGARYVASCHCGPHVHKGS